MCIVSLCIFTTLYVSVWHACVCQFMHMRLLCMYVHGMSVHVFFYVFMSHLYCACMCACTWVYVSTSVHVCQLCVRMLACVRQHGHTVWRDGGVAVCASQYNGHTVYVQCAYYVCNLLATFKCLTLTASRATNTERVTLTINRAATVTPSTADVITREPSRTESAVDQWFNIPPLCGGREAFQREEGEWAYNMVVSVCCTYVQ